MTPALAIYVRANEMGVRFFRTKDRIGWSTPPSLLMTRERMAKVAAHERELLEIADHLTRAIASIAPDPRGGVRCMEPVPEHIVRALNAEVT